MQIEADVVKKLIEESSQVIIMSHRNLDLDALGSSLGIYYLCKTLGKNACLLIDDTKYEDGVSRSLNEIKKQKINVTIKSYSQIEKTIDEKTLLILIDTNVRRLVQNDMALNISNVVVIDHHIQGDDNDIPFTYKYIGEEQSSSVEIIIDLLKHLDIYIHPYIATIMLAGIFIDTNDFFSKTNYKTHEGAAYLYQCGALLNELQYLLKEDMNKYNARQKIISEAEIINNNFIIGIGDDNKIYYKEDLAKISDTMLLFNHVEASFMVGKIGDNTIGISARSLGNVNVQEIMEQLGGGGHLSDAATQIKDATLDAATIKLKNIVSRLKGGFK